jgi:uncharacterized protein YdeI (YjbR/CyaY-like superfamily)
VQPDEREKGDRVTSGDATTPRNEIPVPHDLQIELHDDPEAAAAFAALPPSHQREYIDWIISARRPETRMRRVEETARRVKQPPA